MTTLALFPHQQARDVMPGMAWHGHGRHGIGAGMGFATWALMIAMWWIMMIAMMTPSAAPTILLYARVSSPRRSRKARSRTSSRRPAPSPRAICWSGSDSPLAAAALHWALERAGHRFGDDDGLAEPLAIGRRPDRCRRRISSRRLKISALRIAARRRRSFRAIGARMPGRAAPRRNARRVLCRLLLAADGTVVCGRRDEPGLDRCARHSGADRKGASSGPMGRPRRRHRPDRLGRRHARGLRREHHHLE